MIPYDDRGLLLGDGLFETILADGGRLVWWPEHMARLRAGSAALGLPEPDTDQILSAAEVALQTAGLAAARAAVRVTWTAGSGGRGLDRPEALSPRLFVTAAPAPMASGPTTLEVTEVRRNEGSIAARHKTLAYLDSVLARRAARAAGAEEAVMLNNRGEVACAAAANLFWRTPEGWRTPALACGVLGGLARQAVLARAAAAGRPIAEVAEGLASLDQALEAFVTNSLIGLRPVARLNGRALAINPESLAVYEPLI